MFGAVFWEHKLHFGNTVRRHGEAAFWVQLHTAKSNKYTADDIEKFNIPLSQINIPLTKNTYQSIKNPFYFKNSKKPFNILGHLVYIKNF